MNLWLIGYRCTGKTTVGRLLAEGVGLRFIDADVALTREIGQSISAFVSENGWAAFRREESKIIQNLSQGDGQIVATGGGVVLDPANVQMMRETGTVVWLTARPETILPRLGKDPGTAENRPALTDEGLAAEVRSTLAEREPLYASAAHHSVETDGRGPSEVAARIRALLDSAA
ncbi:MAG: shikimate kinase [Desulfococcaceae bacterium]